MSMCIEELKLDQANAFCELLGGHVLSVVGQKVELDQCKHGKMKQAIQ
jgi:hypothetical protein